MQSLHAVITLLPTPSRQFPKLPLKKGRADVAALTSGIGGRALYSLIVRAAKPETCSDPAAKSVPNPSSSNDPHPVNF